jgi:hypothetical protein
MLKCSRIGIVFVASMLVGNSFAANSGSAPRSGKKLSAKVVTLPATKRVVKNDSQTLEGAAAQGVTLSDEQLALASKVVTGVMPCEFSITVSVLEHPTRSGLFTLETGKQRFDMVPVVTTTGAIRLEDSAQGVIWLQLANKSMLMDQKRSRRLADACMSAEQKAVALTMEKDPSTHLLAPATSSLRQEEFATK